jgi:hypothetical protein
MGELAWWVPRWSYARRLLREHRAVLRSISFTRILTWSLVGSILVYGGFKAAYPDLGMDWLWRLPVMLFGVIVVMGIEMIVLPLLIPPRFTVSNGELRYFQAQTVQWVGKLGECDSFELVVFSPEVSRLRFRYKGTRRSIGVAKSVDLEKLCALLPHPVRILDASRRFAFFHGKRVVGGE